MTTKLITFSLPFPPTVNHYWRHAIIGGHVRVYISARGKKYRTDVIAAVLKEFGILKPIDERLHVSIVAVMPDRRKRDLDNLLKSSLDAMMCAGVFTDDSLIDDLRIVRGVVKPPGRLDVTISLAEQPANKNTSVGGWERC